MKFLILSDTHGRVNRIKEVIKRSSDFDAILFLGDGVHDFDHLESEIGKIVYLVRGNCDSVSFLPNSAPSSFTLECEGHKILLCHGHLFHVKGGNGALLKYASENGYDIALYGHTHVPCEEYIPGEHPVYLFNPGSLGEPCDGHPSFGTLTLTPSTVLFSFGQL